MDYNFDEENWDEEDDDDFETEDWDAAVEYDDFSLNSSTQSSHQNATPGVSSNKQSRPKKAPGTSAGTSASTGEEKVRRGPKKVEMKNVTLSNDSRNLIMDTLRSIHGENFSLDGATEKPKTSKRELGNQYWMDQGQLVVRNAYNYSNKSNIQKDKVNSFALENLELYGFYTNHCCEALLEVENDFERALELLSTFYFNVTYRRVGTVSQKIIGDREDEIVALMSIYDTMCEEREKNKHWVFHLNMPYLGEWFFKNNFNGPTIRTFERRKPMCRLYQSTGTCRYGTSCKFSHEDSKTMRSAHQEAEIKLKSSFNLEIRFPEECNYPEDIPLIIFSAEHREFSNHVCLRITKLLCQEASRCCEQGTAYCYNLIEVLLSADSLLNWLNNESLSKVNISRESSLISPQYPLPGPEASSSSRMSGPWEKKICLEKPVVTNENINRDEDLIKMIRSKQNNDKYRQMQEYRKTLPAWNVGNNILAALHQHQVVVIVGETGCGKSTQVPQFILDEWLFSASGLWKNQSNGRVQIICTQPRRLSAIGVANRVSEERIERTGESVGYQIRLESNMSSLTRLLFCTTGILLKKLETDPFMNDVTHVIVDEVHERDEDSDFLLLILKDLMAIRKDLKIILMSATLNAELFSSYFHNAPLLEIPGKMYPVTEMYLEDTLDYVDYTLDEYAKYSRKINKSLSRQLDSVEYDLKSADILNSSTVCRPSSADEVLSAKQLFFRYKDYSPKTKKTLLLMDTTKIDPELVISVLTWIVDGDHKYPKDGTILVFLPGIADIIAIHDELSHHRLLSPRTGRFIIVPLHSTISNEEQYSVFKKSPRGVRKIVLSTNIAETSITIDDCVFVVDCGKMKETVFDTNKNMSSLEVQWISRANARQRRGRAGRVMPGLCIRLYTKHRHDYVFRAQPVPEIQRAALDQIILRLKTLQQFKFRTPLDVLQNLMEPPEAINIETAIERLKDVGALDADSELTALGRHLAALPVDVKIGKLILFGAIFCCLDSVLTIAASLSNKSPFISPFNKRDDADAKKKVFATGNSDHLTVLKAYQRWQEASASRKQWGRRFAEENFLSWRTLEMMGDLKHQFLELLASIGFVPSNVNLRRRRHEDRVAQITSRHLNRNGDNEKLLAAIICAALYPNLVKIFTPGKVYIHGASGSIPKPCSAEDLQFRTKQDGYVHLHPSSINYNNANFQSPYLVYQEKMKTSKIFIHDSTMVSIISIILFAGNELKIELCSGMYTVQMENGWLVFSINSLQEAKMLQCMRMELSKLLEQKIEDPQLDLATHATGKKIISTITHILSTTIS